MITPHRRRVLEATAELTRASVELAIGRPSRAQRMLGELRRSADARTITDAQLAEARSVGHAVARAAALLPWHPSCLRQAIAAQRMLRRRTIPSLLALGVAKPGEIEAHAWVIVGGEPVVGDGELDRFAVLAGFE